jgi:mRNA-degrading endonuclease toxin of MazEF toxin-antitoxin module
LGTRVRRNRLSAAIRRRRRQRTAIKAGQILWINWRGDALPKEANKLRPGIVVEPSNYFAPQYPNVLVVPCTTSLPTVAPSLCVEIKPDDTNGFVRLTWAIAPGVTSTSKRRIVRETTDFVTPEQLAEIRSLIAEVLDIA